MLDLKPWTKPCFDLCPLYRLVIKCMCSAAPVLVQHQRWLKCKYLCAFQPREAETHIDVHALREGSSAFTGKAVVALTCILRDFREKAV